MAGGVDQKVPRKRKDGSRAHAWKVRYRDPDRVERSRTVRTEADARRFASKIEVSVNEGTYVDPSLGRTLLKDWAFSCRRAWSAWTN